MAVLLYDLCGTDPALRFSPYCWRAKMALAHKGLDVTTVPTIYTRIANIENGASKALPVLKDGDRIVPDSFAIALYLDEAYPDRPRLLGDDATVAACRVVEGWANTALGPVVMRMIVKDIHDVLDAADQPYFRKTREARFGRALEEHQSGVEANADALTTALQPARHALAHYDWLAGSEPRYADHIVFGSLQWLRSIAGVLPLAPDDDVARWFERCLDLYGGLGRAATLAKAA
jgi:glutathione S-transferase